MAEIQQGVKLKHVEKNECKVEIKEMDKKQQDDLSGYLAQMMAQRREQLTKNRKDSSDSNNSGWSDD